MITSHFIPRGYVAIVSAIILSAILTALAFAESTSTFWSRYDQLDIENKMQREALAESHVYDLLLESAQDPSLVPSIPP